MREVTIEDGRVVTHGPERPADTDYTVFVEVSRLLLPRLAEWSEPTQLKVDREEGRVAVLLLRTPERPSEVESLRSRLATVEAERDRLRALLQEVEGCYDANSHRIPRSLREIRADIRAALRPPTPGDTPA